MYSIFANKYRKMQKQPEHTSLDDSDDVFQRALAVWDPVHSVEFEPEVGRALDGLPETFRVVLLLVDVEELSYEEAAAALNCPVGTIRSRLFRARKMLFVELQVYARQQGYAVGSRG
jgi:RNA polymerase sigma-70 factor (ECF subfamily)